MATSNLAKTERLIQDDYNNKGEIMSDNTEETYQYVLPRKDPKNGTAKKKWMNIADLPPNSDPQMSTGRSKADMDTLIASIQQIGLQQPIELASIEGTPNLLMVDGRSRVAAFRILGKTKIEVIIREMTQEEYSMAVIATNNVRTENPYSDAVHIVQVRNDILADKKAKGLPEFCSINELARAIPGMPVSTIKKRMRLADLPPEILNAVLNEEMSPQVAAKVANITDETYVAQVVQNLRAAQATEAEKPEEERKKGNLFTASDLNLIRKGQKTEAATQLVAGETEETVSFDPWDYVIVMMPEKQVVSVIVGTIEGARTLLEQHMTEANGKIEFKIGKLVLIDD